MWHSVTCNDPLVISDDRLCPSLSIAPTVYNPLSSLTRQTMACEWYFWVNVWARLISTQSTRLFLILRPEQECFCDSECGFWDPHTETNASVSRSFYIGIFDCWLCFDSFHTPVNLCFSTFQWINWEMQRQLSLSFFCISNVWPTRK